MIEFCEKIAKLNCILENVLKKKKEKPGFSVGCVVAFLFQHQHVKTCTES